MKSLINVDNEYECNELIHGISNEYLSDLVEMITGTRVHVRGEVEDLYKCPCCGYKTLSEKNNVDESTGYDICPYCGWEDDGTIDIDKYRSINKGSINDYRHELSAKQFSKWLKG